MSKVGQIKKPNRKHKINSKYVIIYSSYLIDRLTNICWVAKKLLRKWT